MAKNRVTQPQPISKGSKPAERDFSTITIEDPTVLIEDSATGKQSPQRVTLRLVDFDNEMTPHQYDECRKRVEVLLTTFDEAENSIVQGEKASGETTNDDQRETNIAATMSTLLEGAITPDSLLEIGALLYLESSPEAEEYFSPARFAHKVELFRNAPRGALNFALACFFVSAATLLNSGSQGLSKITRTV